MPLNVARIFRGIFVLSVFLRKFAQKQTTASRRAKHYSQSMNKESLLKILLLVWAAFSPALLPAQELQITDARRTVEPMTVPLQRLDYNNQICALVWRPSARTSAMS